MENFKTTAGLFLIFAFAAAVIAAVFGSLRQTPPAHADAYLSGFAYRAPITITNSGTATMDYQFKITVPYNPHMKSDFGDIRFTAGDGATLMDYWIESSSAASAVVWVKVNSIPLGNSTIYLYYGNGSAVSAADFSKVFVNFNLSFEKDAAGTSGSSISDWNWNCARTGWADQNWRTPSWGSCPGYTVKEISGSQYYAGSKSYYGHIRASGSARDVLMELSNEGGSRVVSENNYFYVYANYSNTTSSRYAHGIYVYLSDADSKARDIMIWKSWGSQEGCAAGITCPYDDFVATVNGADGQSWKKYKIDIPAGIDRTAMSIGLRQWQDAWDNTTASNSVYWDGIEGLGKRQLIAVEPTYVLGSEAGTCSSQCSTVGLAQCSGNGYQTCGDGNGDGCLEWSSVIACPSGQTCGGAGVCSQNCEEEDYKECYSGDVYWYDSCGVRGQIYDACAASETCANGACSGNCSNDCSTNGAKQCSGNGYRTCGNYDSDSCLEWSTVVACPSGQTCSGNGVCAAICTNGCLIAGTKQCFGNGYQTCGNYDSDSCLEWSSTFACSSGMICKNGACVAAANTQNTTITQTAQTPADAKAPVIAAESLAPTGNINNATATLSVTTDEPSNCKYDIVDADFDSMKNSFDGSGTSHAKSITLTESQDYTYFVRCKDQAGNKSAASSKIEFAYEPKTDNKTPLSISGLGPMGTIYDGNVMLAAATEVPADCRFDIADADFDSMAEKMESNDGINQQAVLSLANFGGYNYYVRCRDKSQKLSDGLAQIYFEYLDPQLEQANQQPAEEEAPSTPVACGGYTMGTEDGQCLAESDCVCDPDCVNGEDDADCANAPVEKKSGANWIGAALGGLGLLVLAGIVLMVLRKRKGGGDIDIDDASLPPIGGSFPAPPAKPGVPAPGN